LQIGGDKKNRVLIVVDVQQCFFENFGTMGWTPKNFSNTNTEKVLERNYVKHLFVQKLNKFIKEAQLKYDIIVFTKDRHPIGHRSFGTYPPHCIDEHKTCDFSYHQNIAKDLKLLIDTPKIQKPQAGHKLISANSTDLEDLKYDYKISYGGDINNNPGTTELKNLDLRGKINYEQTKDQSTTKIDKLNIEEKTGAIIVRLNKGELCNFDAYGAFVYHVEYKKSSTTLKNERRNANVYSSRHVFDPSGENNILYSLDSISDLSKISTGLGEFLLKYYGGNFAEDMVIDVCGLVTNICVVNSCIGGIKFFENIKKRLQQNLNIPHFRILNEYSLYLYAFPLSEMQCLDFSQISYEIYGDENEYNKEKHPNVSIIGKPAADGYEPLPNTAESNE